MTIAAWVFVALAGTAAVVDWIAVGRDDKRTEYLFKPATLLLLIALAVALEPHDAAVRAWFVVALALSLAGDVFLMLPGASSHRSSPEPIGDEPSSGGLFLGGLGAFLLAHVAYAGGLFTDGVDVRWALVGVAVVAVAIAAVGPAIVRGAHRSEPALAGPVVLYMAMISTMLVAAIGTGRAAAIVGAGLFYASDALIGWSRFVHPRRLSLAPVAAAYGTAPGTAQRGAEAAVPSGGQDLMPLAIIVTYHLGQIALVLSLAV